MSAVEVNEARIMSLGAGRDWWTDFRRAQHPSRITIVQATIIGDLVRVACDSREDAKALTATMVDHAHIPKTAVRVVAS